jgi:hypothetical protein
MGDVWQFQILAQNIILCLIRLDNEATRENSLEDPRVTKSLHSDGKSSRRTTALVKADGKLPSKPAVDKNELNGQAGEPITTWLVMCQEICKLGLLRSLCWGLLSAKGAVRRGAYFVLKELVVVRLLTSTQLNRLNRREVAAVQVDCSIALIEQGLVPLLEHIAGGMLFSGVGSPPYASSVSALNCSLQDWSYNYCALRLKESSCCQPTVPHRATPPSAQGLVSLFPECVIRQLASHILTLLTDTVKAGMKYGFPATPPEHAGAVAPLGKQALSASSKLTLEGPATSKKHSVSKGVVVEEMVFKRLVNALLVSGNVRLKTNIFTGVLFLCGQDAELGNLFWVVPVPQEMPPSPHLFPRSGSTKEEGGPLFAYLLGALSVDCGGLLNIVVAPLLNVLSLSLSEKMRDTSRLAAPAEAESRPCPLIPNLSPLIAVASEGSLLKMQCPSIGLIRSHSESLAKSLETELNNQIQKCREHIAHERRTDAEFLNPSSLLIDPAAFGRVIGKLPISEMCVCMGRYSVWQELFSHMQDSFLLASSLRSMHLTEILEAYLIARCFGMVRLLEEYTTALIQRMNVADIGIIFETALGVRSVDSLSAVNQRHNELNQGTRTSVRGVPVTNVLNVVPRCERIIPVTVNKPHLSLCCACLQYLSINMEKVFKLTNSQSRIIQLLHVCVRHGFVSAR